MVTALIDGDILAYEVGFGSQHKTYKAEDGTSYESKRDAAVDGANVDTLTEMIHAESVGYARSLMRDKINGILEATKATDFKLYLTGNGNFRDNVATILRYKGERDPNGRPAHYQMLRDYMMSKYNGIVVEGFEADDALAIEATQDVDNTVICTRDKDLRQIEGYHYSWQAHNQEEKPVEFITELEGWRNLSTQMLTGDNVDNILGVVGIGPAKAAKALQGCSTKEEFNEAVLDAYNNVYGNVAYSNGLVHYVSWDGRLMWKTPQEIARENYLLLRMLTEKKWLNL